MIEAEDMLVFMPHPRTKGSTGYPDAIRESAQFQSDWYRGVGWRWAWAPTSRSAGFRKRA